MTHTVIVTDSTADIPEELAKKHGIHVVPLRLQFGGESLLDGVEISAKEFYDRLDKATELPTTSQPSPADYVRVYEQIQEEHPGASILSIHISSGLSGTYQSALIAKSMMEENVDLTVVDSLSASYGFGLLVVHAARLASQGMAVEDIVIAVEQLRKERKLYFLVDTLEYLQKGGRIGKAAALFGTLLNIKPILSIDQEGIIYAVEKVRGRNKAVARMIELFKQDLGNIGKINVAVGHTANPATAESFLTELSGHFELEEVVLTNVGSVVGSHVGRGTIAVFIWPA
ncbi:DegV family protein [Paenibacillus crassostreae]|uniref:EDD domain protein n=1 Tax=Paenibacillus crassostreae TaxID=1763538 RepID=A0A167DFY4_9BACL|nr:DegV family protein [Paenibacillus crassostreae]AOZ91519.1 EDD domain protein [Paenibacillus crassostreae]OAB74322.1 EDD domain protein [Paenibacillus crassostreae]